MIRATTPTHIFNIPFDTSLIKELLITYSQKKIPIVDKVLDDCVLDGKRIALTLTQRDTSKFSDRRNVEIQIRILTTSDTSLAGTIVETEVDRVLDDDILGSDPKKKPTVITGDDDISTLSTCEFDVDFGEIYIIGDGSGGFPEDYSEYGEEGEPFEFIPKVDEKQQILTAKKYLERNLVVDAIPYVEVDNVSNGKTVTIG